jgi:hypothetical protein
MILKQEYYSEALNPTTQPPSLSRTCPQREQAPLSGIKSLSRFTNPHPALCIDLYLTEVKYPPYPCAEEELALDL